MTSEGAERRKKRAPQERADSTEPSGFFPELLRRGLTLGFTGFFLTEEAVRKALGESVPGDVLEFMLDQSERMRKEFLDRMSKEFGRALERVDPVELARRLLEGGTVEVTARFQLVPKEQFETEKKRKRKSGAGE
ncbi:MAG: hypothetical protein ABFS41_06740 [Myxococcota bacterium]